MSSVAPLHENGTIRWTNVPRQPIPPLDDVSLWVGHQLNHKRMPKEYKHMPPDGELMVSLEGYPEGLLAIPNDDGSPRIIVPRTQIKSLVLQCHEDIHHQSHVKVLHILKPLFYWPGMNDSIERLCTACQTCLTTSVRRKHLKAKFDLNAPPSTMLPRQARLWDRFLRSIQGGNISNRGPIHERDNINASQYENTRQCRKNHPQEYHISTRGP
jgi:hypothetical protein